MDMGSTLRIVVYIAFRCDGEIATERFLFCISSAVKLGLDVAAAW